MVSNYDCTIGVNKKCLPNYRGPYRVSKVVEKIGRRRVAALKREREAEEKRRVLVLLNKVKLKSKSLDLCVWGPILVL